MKGIVHTFFGTALVLTSIFTAKPSIADQGCEFKREVLALANQLSSKEAVESYEVADELTEQLQSKIEASCEKSSETHELIEALSELKARYGKI